MSKAYSERKKQQQNDEKYQKKFEKPNGSLSQEIIKKKRSKYLLVIHCFNFELKMFKLWWTNGGCSNHVFSFWRCTPLIHMPLTKIIITKGTKTKWTQLFRKMASNTYIGWIGNQFSKENFFVRVEGVDDQWHKLSNFSLKSESFNFFWHLWKKFERKKSRISKTVQSIETARKIARKLLKIVFSRKAA